jgi:branched-chain amino acid transport system ATP-binding protein
MVRSMIEAFQALKQAGETILLVEQNFHAASVLGDRVVVIDDGRVAHAGAMSDLVADQAMQQRLLGLSMDAHQ